MELAAGTQEEEKDQMDCMLQLANKADCKLLLATQTEITLLAGWTEYLAGFLTLLGSTCKLHCKC